MYWKVFWVDMIVVDGINDLLAPGPQEHILSQVCQMVCQTGSKIATAKYNYVCFCDLGHSNC